MDAALTDITAWFAQFSALQAALAGAGVVAALVMLRAWLKRPSLPDFEKVAAAQGKAQGICARVWSKCRGFFKALDYLSTRREWRYRQPWVLVLGEQAAGKSSMLHSVSAAMRHVPPQHADELGASRTEWFFFRKGALIDPQGKYPDAEPGGGDSRAWDATLEELKALRPERPLDGLVLCVSARTLVSAGSEDRAALLERLSRQLTRLQERIEFMLPLTVVVTQCDVVAGFPAYWDSQNTNRRMELFGYAAPPQLQSATPSEWADDAFATLDERLRALQVDTAARNDHIADGDDFFLFPGRFRRLREPIRALLENIFRTNAWQPGYLFRGIFFTGSSTQNGGLSEEICRDVAFVDALLPVRVLAEPGLARPTRNGVFSRNKLIRGLQYGVIGMTVALFTSLYFTANRVSAQVNTLVSATEQLQDSSPEATAHGDCLSAEAVYPLLAEVARIDHNTRYWTIPASWLDTRIVHRNDTSIEQGAIGKVLMPTLACRLENRAKALLPYRLKLPNERDPNAYATLRQAFLQKLQQVREFEENLERFEKLAEHGDTLPRDELLDTLQVLSQYAFEAALPPEVMQERGALSDGFGGLANVARPMFSPHLRNDLSNQIRQLSEALRHALSQEVGRGAPLLDQLRRGEQPMLENTRRLGEWLAWVEKSWLLSTPQLNPCEEIHSEAKDHISVLIGRFAYAKSLWRNAERFDTLHCYQAEMQALGALRQAPYGPLFVPRKSGGQGNPDTEAGKVPALELSSEIRGELLGLPSLIQLNFMRIRNPRAFKCEPSGEGFRQSELSEAAGYVREYERFAAQMKLPPGGAGSRPLYDTLARLSLAHALDDAMQRAQIPVTESPYRQVGLEAVTQADRELAGISKELSGGLETLLGLLRSYGDYGAATSTPLVRQCARNFAADNLSRVSALAASSRLYAPTPAPIGEQIFDLGSVPVQKEYLARQVARAQVLANYATPFMTLLQGSQGVNDTRYDNEAGAEFWRNTIDEINRYTQGKEPNGQVANLDNYFFHQLGDLTYANCAQQLAKYQSPGFGNDLFSTRRRALEPMVQLRCVNRRVAQAMETYTELARRFNQDLAGRYPFADRTAPDAHTSVVRQFFSDYAQQRAAMGDAMTVLNGEAARDARSFVAELDAAADFFRSILPAADSDAGMPVRLQLSFNAPGQPASGGDQIVKWSFFAGPRSVGQPNRGNALDWQIGETTALELVWADRSLWTPVPDARQDDLQVDGNVAAFSASGPWALLRMVETHAVNNAAAAARGQLLLGFSVPQQRDGANGKAERGRADLYLGMALSSTDPKTKADTRLRIPARFPKRAPVLAE